MLEHTSWPYCRCKVVNFFAIKVTLVALKPFCDRAHIPTQALRLQKSVTQFPNKLLVGDWIRREVIDDVDSICGILPQEHLDEMAAHETKTSGHQNSLAHLLPPPFG